MSELKNMLKHQARMMRKNGSIALGDLFENAFKEIEQLEQRNAELVEQINSIHAANGRKSDEQFEARKVLKEQLAKANKRNAELEKMVEDGFFEASCHDVDVIQCLNKMAYAHNEKEIPSYRDKAKQCAKRISKRVGELNKFAVEQQIKGIEDAINSAPSRVKFSLPLVDINDLYAYQEQLRKGGDV